MFWRHSLPPPLFSLAKIILCNVRVGVGEGVWEVEIRSSPFDIFKFNFTFFQLIHLHQTWNDLQIILEVGEHESVWKYMNARIMIESTNVHVCEGMYMCVASSLLFFCSICLIIAHQSCILFTLYKVGCIYRLLHTHTHKSTLRPLYLWVPHHSITDIVAAIFTTVLNINNIIS